MAHIKNAIKNGNQGIEVGNFFQTSVYNPYAKSTTKIQSSTMIIDFFLERRYKFCPRAYYRLPAMPTSLMSTTFLLGLENYEINPCSICWGLGLTPLI